MLTKAELIELQIQIELESKAQSIEKARQADEHLKSKGQHSKSQAGLALHGKIISSAVALMAEDINYYHRTFKGGGIPVCYKLLLDNERVAPYIEPEEMAHIALVTMLDSVREIPTIPSTQIFTAIGNKIEDQARMRKVQELDPKFFDRLTEAHLKTSESYSRKMVKVMAEVDFREIDNNELSWDKWNSDERVAIGAWASWIIHQSTSWFQEITLPPCKADPFGTTKYLMFSSSAVSEAESIEELRFSLAYDCKPMLCKPREFVDVDTPGGFIIRAPGQISKLIHGHSAGSIPSQLAIDFINNLQRQPFLVNEFILEILEKLSRQNTSIGSFKSYISKTKNEGPVIDPDIWLLPDTDLRKKEAFVEIMKHKAENSKHKEQSISPKQKLALARWVHNYEIEFFSPWFFDTRLRAYPTSNFHPQGADYEKALLLFADGAPVTRENIDQTELFYKIAIANTYGNQKDKRPFYGLESRVSWASAYIEENLHTILHKPLSKESKAIWTKADEPFQHLALLKEYNEVIRNWRPGVLAHVPIGFDATCSGLQLLGSFVKDEETCRLVNVLPSDRPQDAYRAVANKAVEILSDPERWRQLRGRSDDKEHGIPLDKVDRSVAKKVVMLIPYGGAYDTLARHVGLATKDWKLGMRDTHTLTKALIQGMAEAVPGFSALNRWFKEAAACVMASDAEFIQWTTPTGSHIQQNYRIPKTHRINTVALGVSNYKDPEHYGSTQSTVIDKSSDGEVNKRKSQTALAANWTHSMDAAVLQQAFHDFDQPFTTVHDCLYAPASVIPDAVERIREAFVKVTTHNALQQFIDDNNIEFPLPPIGKANVESAIESDYLFS